MPPPEDGQVLGVDRITAAGAVQNYCLTKYYNRGRIQIHFTLLV